MITSPERELEIIGIHFYLLYKKSQPESDWLQSGKRGSNPRPPAWKASALSTELFPHFLFVLRCKGSNFINPHQIFFLYFFVFHPQSRPFYFNKALINPKEPTRLLIFINRVTSWPFRFTTSNGIYKTHIKCF